MFSTNFVTFTTIFCSTVMALSFQSAHCSLENSNESKTLEATHGARIKRSFGNPEAFTKAEESNGLAIHNQYRSNEGASNMEYMEWHPELARMAQDYAEGCLYEHSSMVNNGCYNITYDRVGENLHFNTAKVPLTDAVTAWFNEKVDYDFTFGNCSENKVCGHYTQVVWAKSKLVGCGRAFCAELKEDNGNVEKNAYFTSCNYGSKGNYGKNRPYMMGDSCTACPVDKKACKDQMCYKPGVDYQRPPDKLKDCGATEASDDSNPTAETGIGKRDEQTVDGESQTKQGHGDTSDGNNGEEGDEGNSVDVGGGKGDGEGGIGGVGAGVGDDEDGSGGDDKGGSGGDDKGGSGGGGGGVASRITVFHGYFILSVLLIFLFN